jgi:hypothetical protein
MPEAPTPHGLERAPASHAREPEPAHPPLRFGSVLIVTYGRSGSTLLQGVLNSIEGALVRGENDNFVYHLFHAYQALCSSTPKPGLRLEAHLPISPRYGAGELDPAHFLETCRREIRTQLCAGREQPRPEPRIFGFKEIRYIECRADFHEYLGFLRLVFPEPCFVFNTRDFDEVSRSSWWQTHDRAELRALLDDMHRLFAEALAREPERGFLIDYQELTANGARVEELFAFLGAPYDRERVAAVLREPHSNATTIKDRSRVAKMLKARAEATADPGAGTPPAGAGEPAGPTSGEPDPRRGP